MRYLITSALPYINGVKHLGNLIGSMLPAEVYARFLRQCGNEVLYICGTDEHGTPAEIAAFEAKKEIDEYCLEMHDLQKGIYEGFDISFDFFGRTSSQSNHELTVEIFKLLYTNGFIEEKFINQYYSFEDKRFLPDRYVEGTCPNCHYEKARGDQCDGCGNLLNPEELLNPYSSISKSKNIELKKTKHFFLNMPKLEADTRHWVDKQKCWSDIVRGIAKKWLNEGLLSRCITRDLKWGISVPIEWIENYKKNNGQDTAVQNNPDSQCEQPDSSDDYEEEIKSKVFYVWFDAPNGYISITKDWANSINKPDEYKKWWFPNNKTEVSYVQFMAKDNIPFHSIFWPAMLIGTKGPFKQVDDIKGFHWLTYEKGKFSTSQKRGVFTDRALELFPSDYWRYYLLSNCPESSDSDFSFESFASIINKDLADVLGNFANRTLVLFEKHFELKIGAELNEIEIDYKLVERCKVLVDGIYDHLSHRRFRLASGVLRSLWVLGNEYITEKEPWNLIKTDKKATEIVLLHCIHLLRIFAIVSNCFIPKTAQKIFDLLNDSTNISKDGDFKSCVNFNIYKKCHNLGKPTRLFEKIDDRRVAELAAAFSGDSSTNVVSN